jgi:predicted oxidoreductase
MGLGGGWNDTPISKQDIEQVNRVIDTSIESGITLFDHADIYTFGKAEQAFGEVLKQRSELRQQIAIQSKCAIRFKDNVNAGRYDFSEEWIMQSVERILERLNIEQLDVLLLHRPDALMIPEEVARTVENLQQQGKIANLGVSNMNMHQMALLQSALKTPIVCNQLEMSLSQLNWLDEGVSAFTSSTLGTIEYCRAHDVQIQAWGSLSQGLFTGKDISNEPQKVKETAKYIAQLAEENRVSKEAIVLAWLMRHPAGIQPVIGTTNLDRIKASAQATQVNLTREQWYNLYTFARGNALP